MPIVKGEIELHPLGFGSRIVWDCTTTNYKMTSPGSDVQEVLQQYWPTLDTETFQYICGTSVWHIHFVVQSHKLATSGIISSHIMPLQSLVMSYMKFCFRYDTPSMQRK